MSALADKCYKCGAPVTAGLRCRDCLARTHGYEVEVGDEIKAMPSAATTALATIDVLTELLISKGLITQEEMLAVLREASKVAVERETTTVDTASIVIEKFNVPDAG